jgi:hypothetical protein
MMGAAQVPGAMECYDTPIVGPRRYALASGKDPDEGGWTLLMFRGAMRSNSAEMPVNMGGDSLPPQPSRNERQEPQ